MLYFVKEFYRVIYIMKKKKKKRTCCLYFVPFPISSNGKNLMLYNKMTK